LDAREKHEDSQVPEGKKMAVGLLHSTSYRASNYDLDTNEKSATKTIAESSILNVKNSESK